MSAQSSNFWVFRLQPMYFNLLLYKKHMLWIIIWMPRLYFCIKHMLWVLISIASTSRPVNVIYIPVITAIYSEKYGLQAEKGGLQSCILQCDFHNLFILKFFISNLSDHFLQHFSLYQAFSPHNTLRKHAYSNMIKYIENFTSKNWKCSDKKLWYFSRRF